MPDPERLSLRARQVIAEFTRRRLPSTWRPASEKPESNASRIQRFCKTTGLFRYSKAFVSIAVLPSDEDPCNSGAAIYTIENGSNLSHLDFAVLPLAKELLDSIEIVGNDDLKQVLNLIAGLWEKGQSYESELPRIKNLSLMNREDKHEATFALTRHRGQHNYSEARLNRALELKEVADWGTCDTRIGEEPEERGSGDDIASYFLGCTVDLPASPLFERGEAAHPTQIRRVALSSKCPSPCGGSKRERSGAG
jgi:hypothetical protein